MSIKLRGIWCVIIVLFFSCGKDKTVTPKPPDTPPSFAFNSLKVNDAYNGFTYYHVNLQPVIKFSFQAAIDHESVNKSISFKTIDGSGVAYNTLFEDDDKTIVIQPAADLAYITQFIVNVSTALKSKEGGSLRSAVSVNLTTSIDSSDKFTRITDDALLDLVQKQSFAYFKDFAHPVSGMARERNSSADVVTTGGTGFGIMSIIAAASRNFITRTDAAIRVQKIVSFLKNNCTAYHGAYAHWINGSTGATVPFSEKDDGADLVETSYLMQGLLCARQYFNAAASAEINLRNDINSLWSAVEWTWFQKNNEDVLYWHWSPKYNWDMNMKITGWNEALIVYALAASSNTYPISKQVYDKGWANNGTIKNGNTYYGQALPLGEANGGPLFFSHYSFLGINPHDLKDAYADYWQQVTAHSKINYAYCVANPKNYNGYSNACWGLTASDNNINGYSAQAPNNDLGIISPTAAISSLPYTPVESLNALRFFYYKLGDKIWGQYGFIDAFNLTEVWFADSYLAIDQGPQIVMIENYRSGLLWNLFMSCPEIKTGMKALGFQSPYL